METSYNNKSEYGFWLDLGFIKRLIRQWLIVLLSLSIIAGIVGYIAFDIVLQDTYSASALVSVVPKENSAGLLSANNISKAMTRNKSMWDSSTLLKLIKDENPSVSVKGNISATIVKDTNLINITSTANTAEDAYVLLHSALKYYRQIEANFDKNYHSVLLTGSSGSNISVTYKKPALFGVAGLVGVALGLMVLLCLWSALTDVIHNESQAKQLLAIPVYEALPFINKVKRKIKAILITQKGTELTYLEGIDRLTARIEQHLLHRNKKIVMVSSVQENEGKSTVAVNLAINLSRRGGKTLLIDMDFCRPVLYKIFDHEDEEKTDFSDRMKDFNELTTCIKHLDEFYNVDALFQYRAVRDSDRVLEKMPLEDILSKLSEQYDYIVIDTPPVGPVRDAEVLSTIIEDILLVVRQDFIRASVVNDVIDQLEEHGALCMGVVLNNCQDYRSIGRSIRSDNRTFRNRRRNSDNV